MRWIAHIGVAAFPLGRSIEAQLAACVKVKCLCRGGPGWPALLATPYIGACLKDHGFGLRFALALEVVLEKRELDGTAKILRRIGIERDIAQMVSVAASPAAMHPGPLDQRRRRFGIVLADGIERLVRPAQILGVVPSAHHQHRALHVLHVQLEVAHLPVVVVGVMLHLVRIQRVCSLEVFVFHLLEVPGVQVKPVGIGRPKIKRHRGLRLLGIAPRLEEDIEAEICRQHKRAAMVRVVALEKIRHRGLGAGCDECGMRIDDARRGIKSRVRNPPDAHLAVVVFDRLQQKVDGVMGIRSIIHIGWRLLVVDVRRHLDEGAFAQIAPAHILVNEDVATLFKLV